MTYHGKIRNGVIELPAEANLPEGAEVRVELIEPRAALDEPDAAYLLEELAVETGMPDLSVNLDHYLYGHPQARGDG